MKKLLIILSILILSACTSTKQENEETIKIVSPTGAPSLAFISEIDNVNFETNSNPTNIVSMMNEASDYDVVVIDTINGLKAIEKGAPYKLAATITFGNFYLVSTGNDNNGLMNEGDRICLFSKDGQPDLLFHYLYGNKYDENIEYVSAVSDAGKVLALGKNLETGNDIDYVMIAEPILTKILNNQEAKTYGKATIYKNLQEEYKDKTSLSICQASVFVKDGKNYDLFLTELEQNIKAELNVDDYVQTHLKDYDEEKIAAIYGIGFSMIESALNKNSIGLGYKKAYDIRDSIDNYVSIFNMSKIDEKVYYQ